MIHHPSQALKIVPGRLRVDGATSDEKVARRTSGEERRKGEGNVGPHRLADRLSCRLGWHSSSVIILLASEPLLSSPLLASDCVTLLGPPPSPSLEAWISSVSCPTPQSSVVNRWLPVSSVLYSVSLGAITTRLRCGCSGSTHGNLKAGTINRLQVLFFILLFLFLLFFFFFS